ncbi:hypothetical protein ACOACO_15175 [Nocardioides sp. CPCC 205120]|uniref:hypothetical protein n=1 Tax=Nocardioides sp. CPCC 205120 TaxID=3406462 RepID=UPI003B50F9B5
MSGRRTALLAALGAAAFALAGCGAGAGGADDTASQAGAAPEPGVAPAGMRLVGVGDLVVPVPEEWSTDRHFCGTPMGDTVLTDQGGTCLAFAARPADVTAVELFEDADRLDQGRDGRARPEPGDDGLRRWPVHCDGAAGSFGAGSATTFCTADVASPATGSVRVTSSLTDVDEARATVEGVVAAIRPRSGDEAIVPARPLSVPGIAESQDRGGAYAEAVRSAGLSAEVVEKRAVPARDGQFVDVSVEPGTVLARGTAVEIQVASAPRGPADVVEIHAWSWVPGAAATRDLSDADIRAGARVELPVGGEVRVEEALHSAPVDPWHQGVVVEAEADGSSVEEITEGWDAGTFRATAAGTGTITLTASKDGTTQTIGTITVEVVG